MFNERSESITINGVLLDEELKKELKRIRNFESKPCPVDFPEKLKKYWKGHLEYSYTPCETGWRYLAEQKRKQ